MANGITAGWKFTSPIPTDPVYSKGEYNSQSVRDTYKHRSHTSPIPVDPVYSNDCNYQRDHAPRPRIKPEAMNIARLHQGGALAQLFNPGFRTIPVGTHASKYSIVHLKMLQFSESITLVYQHHFFSQTFSYSQVPNKQGS